MQFKLGSMFLVALIALAPLVGCEIGQDMIMEMMPSTDTGMDDMTDTTPPMDTGMEEIMDMMSSMDGEMVDTESDPVKLVWLINYPFGGKDAYLAWVASVVPTLQAPEELKRVASYDNLYGENPHRLVEFEFDSFADAATYLNRPDIAAVFEALPNHSSEANAHIYVQRSDYSKNEDASRAVKLVYLIDYPLGGKAAYLEWVASIAQSLQEPEEVKRIASYDSYLGTSPHRLVEFEFDSIEDSNSYQERPELQAINAELPNRAGNATLHTFVSRLDYDE